MMTERPLVFVIYPLAMGACVAISLWVLLGVLRVERFAGNPQDMLITMPPVTSNDSGPKVEQLQKALVGKGYFIGPAGADGNFGDDTVTALMTFQDNNALPVESQCDQQCWTELLASDRKRRR